MKLLVINPNSDAVFTDAIRQEALAVAAPGTEIDCVDVKSAPRFIDTCLDDLQAAPGMLRYVEQGESVYDAFVVACACDPNVDALRELTEKPVVGIGEASMMLAMMLGERFTILQTGLASVPKKRELVRKYGFQERCASLRAVDEASDAPMEQRLLDAGLRAIEEDFAEVIILGCAGFAGLADRMSERLGVPVVSGVASGVKIAEALAACGCRTSKRAKYRLDR